ncbi:hypothetical protein [Vibrio harveyi]|uniref:hypothetical protein n=1 Tax=Vibrio harveyi TaxID=669 RepID=UPI003CF78139
MNSNQLAIINFYKSEQPELSESQKLAIVESSIASLPADQANEVLVKMMESA